MERVHKCKVCLKRFSNGRALGGHMRSHMVNVAPPLMGDSALWSTPSSSSDGDGELCYGLRENPKRSIRMVDPEFSFAASSVVVQDGESETESSKNPTPRRRSKRRIPHYNSNNSHVYNQKPKKKEKESEAEAVSSSISGTTTEEDVAFWLMMLSRDKWTATQEWMEEEEEEEESDDSDSDDSQGLKFSKNRSNNRGRYECETCNKAFGSYQALGGHRASHKKIKAVPDQRTTTTTITTTTTTISRHQTKKTHECPVCFRVFASGQALGGHKRSHVAGFSSTPLKTPRTPTPQSFIDLNLPAPFDEDDLSALSDAHFLTNTTNNINAITH